MQPDPFINSKSASEFLKNWIEIHFQKNSLETIAKKCHLSSKGALHDILSGRSKATLESIQKIAQGLKIRGTEKKLLLALWEIERTHSDNSKINELRKKIKTKQSKINVQKMPLLPGWDYVYSMLDTSEEGLSLDQISKKSKISKKEVEKILSNLVELNLAEMTSQNQCYRSTALHSFFEKDSFDEKKYLLNKLSKLKKTLEADFGKREKAIYRNIVFSIRPQQFLQLRERIKLLIDEFTDEGEDSSGSELVELFVSFERK